VSRTPTPNKARSSEWGEGCPWAVVRVAGYEHGNSLVFDREYKFTLYENPADPVDQMACHYGDIPGCEPLVGAVFSAPAGFRRKCTYRFACAITGGGGIAG
jgi:hypothetical protein